MSSLKTNLLRIKAAESFNLRFLAIAATERKTQECYRSLVRFHWFRCFRRSSSGHTNFRIPAARSLFFSYDL